MDDKKGISDQLYQSIFVRFPASFKLKKQGTGQSDIRLFKNSSLEALLPFYSLVETVYSPFRPFQYNNHMTVTRFQITARLQRLLTPVLAVWFIFLLGAPVFATATPTPTAETQPVLTPAVQFDAYGNLVFDATPTLMLSRSEPKSVRYDVPFIRQRGLEYLGKETPRGCTAASVAMLMLYWNGVYGAYPTMTAQQIIDVNTAQGQFHPDSGLSIENVEDELNSWGYQLAIITNSSKETLLRALAEIGPVAALVKEGWKPTGANHMVIVTGYNAKNDILHINDPNLSQPLDLYWSTFDKIWSIDYSASKSSSLKRSFFIVAPTTLPEPSATPEPLTLTVTKTGAINPTSTP